MKRNILITAVVLVFVTVTALAANNGKAGQGKTAAAGNDSKYVVHLTTQQFKEKVFNYDKNKEWKYEGNTPCIVDFYADWCMPCKRIAPILEQLANEYDGKIIVYKVNTEKEPELAGAFGIQSIPTLLFVPVSGQPRVAQGALPKETLKQAIDEVLLNKKQ